MWLPPQSTFFLNCEACNTVNCKAGYFGGEELKDPHLILYPVIAQRTTEPHSRGGALDMQKSTCIKSFTLKLEIKATTCSPFLESTTEQYLLSCKDLSSLRDLTLN